MRADNGSLGDPQGTPLEHKTVEQEERGIVTAGQRRVNLLWELTQAVIAIAVTVTTLYVAARLVTEGTDSSLLQAAFLLLSNAFFLVIGFYFGRTNHQRTGGVGSGESGR